MKEVECCPESIGGNWSQIASGSFFFMQLLTSNKK